MAIPAWLPISISAAGTIVALSAFAYQVHRARFNQSVDLLFRLENDFFGPAKKLQRAKACRDLAEGHPLEAEPILDFFETMALLLRRGALDAEMVWHTFFYWIDNYYSALQPYIADRQKTDPLVWQDFIHLVQVVRDIQTQRLGRPLTKADSAKIEAFLIEEQTEDAA
jgi:hypothetical protein